MYQFDVFDEYFYICSHQIDKIKYGLWCFITSIGANHSNIGMHINSQLKIHPYQKELIHGITIVRNLKAFKDIPLVKDQ